MSDIATRAIENPLERLSGTDEPKENPFKVEVKCECPTVKDYVGGVATIFGLLLLIILL